MRCSLISAFYAAGSHETVSNCPPIHSQDGEVSVQCTLKRGTKQTAKEETAPKRLNISSELARQGVVGPKAFLTVILCLTAFRRTGKENKANKFIYNSLLNSSVLFCLTQSLPRRWNSHVKTQATTFE